MSCVEEFLVTSLDLDLNLLLISADQPFFATTLLTTTETAQRMRFTTFLKNFCSTCAATHWSAIFTLLPLTSTSFKTHLPNILTLKVKSMEITTLFVVNLSTF